MRSVHMVLAIVAALAMSGNARAQGTESVAIPISGVPMLTLLPAVVVDSASSGPLALMNSTAYVSGTDVPPSSQTVGNFVYNNPGYTSYSGVACFDFINHGSRPITKATFVFNAAGSGGIILNVGSASATGLFATGDETSAGLARAHVCLEYITSVRPVIGRFLVNVGLGRIGLGTPISEILVAAKAVTYDDGTTWQAQHAMQVGDHVPTIAGPSPSPASPGWPIVRVENVAAAPFRVIDAFTYVPQRGVTFHNPIPQFGVCAALDAIDGAKVRQAQVAVAYIATDGTVAAVDTIAMHGGRFYSECRASPGAINDGAFIYNIRRGAPSTSIARVIVTPLSEEFSDGTMWTNPTVPVVGSRLPPPAP